MNKQAIANILRHLKLLNLADKIYFYKIKNDHKADNIKFSHNHPEVSIPPDKMLYEILGNNSYGGYWQSGLTDSKWLLDIISTYKQDNKLKIAEWGCGVARVIRHLNKPGKEYSCYGFDYCEEFIKWCQKNISDCEFMSNELSPPLNVEENTFDVLYCISVFTHLSAAGHFKWIEEIYRILKPGGLFIGTFHGEKHRFKLRDKDQELFDTKGLVILDKVLEGSKNYTAYQSADFLKNTLLKYFENAVEIQDVPFHQNVWCAIKPLQS